MIQMLKQKSKFITIILLILLSLFPLYVAFTYPPYLNDDSLITLTFVKNLVNGNGFVYNFPPPILGTTTPFFTFLVTGLKLLLPFFSITDIAVFLTAFCWLGIPWLFYLFKEHWGLLNWQVIVLSSVVIASGWVGFLGMEVYLFAFLLVLCFSLFYSRRYILAGVLAGCLFLTRGEGVLILPLLMIIVLVENLKENGWKLNKGLFVKLSKVVIGFLIPVLIWLVYSLCTFGAFLPNTLGAKQAQGQSKMGASFVNKPIKDWIPTWGAGFNLPIFNFINLWWLVVLLGTFFVFLKQRLWLVYVGWMVIYTAGYQLLDVSTYWWYQYPILFVFTLLFGFGIIFVVNLILRVVQNKHLAYILSILFVTGMVLLMVKPTIITVLTYEGDQRGPTYINLSQWINDNTAPEESIAFVEVGYIGYYTDNQIIDLLGLVTPEIIPHIAEGDFSWGFWHYEPDYYIHLSDFNWLIGEIKSDPRFEAQYALVTTLSGPRGTDFKIYERVAD